MRFTQSCSCGPRPAAPAIRRAPAAEAAALAEIGGDVAAVAAGIERGDDGLAVGPVPDADIERNAFRRLFRRIRPADARRRLPRRTKASASRIPSRPAWARMLGSDAGNPKQSGSMYSSLALPNSLRKYVLP